MNVLYNFNTSISTKYGKNQLSAYELTSAVGKTADQNNIFDPAVCTVSIAMEHPGEAMEKSYRMIPTPSGSVIIQDDRRFPIGPTQVDPHIGL